MISQDQDMAEWQEYYQTLSDLLTIFWEFHKARLEAGDLEYVYMKIWQDGETKIHSYDPQMKINLRKERNNTRPLSVVEDFEEDVQWTINESWQQFLGCLDKPSAPQRLGHLPISEKALSVIDSYTVTLADKAELLGTRLCYVAAISFYGFSLSKIGKIGLDTGASTIGQLIALFGEEFKPLSARLLAKVSLKNVSDARNKIGINDYESDVMGIFRNSGDYSLLDTSTIGLNKNVLKELGLGETIGCPAALLITPETRAFLESKGFYPSHRSMLEDFASRMANEFNRYIRKWYNDLSPEERLQIIDAESNRMLSGEARRTAIDESKVPRCPFSKES